MLRSSTAVFFSVKYLLSLKKSLIPTETFGIQNGCRSLTRAAAHVLRDDAAEVPEAGLAAVTLLTPDPGLAGALAGDGVTRALVGAVGVAMAGTWQRKKGKREKGDPKS